MQNAKLNLLNFATDPRIMKSHYLPMLKTYQKYGTYHNMHTHTRTHTQTRHREDLTLHTAL